MAVCDEFLRHEVYDRASMMMGVWGHWICNHPAVEADLELSKSAVAASNAMGDFYQLAAAKFIGADEGRSA